MTGYSNYENCSEENYIATLADLETLVEQIQKEALFSPNEELKDVATEHLKLLMVPYLEAEVLTRIMDNREERVRQAHTYYLEYLKLMRHYNLLEKHQVAKLKSFLQRRKGDLVESDTKLKDIKQEDRLAG